MALLYVWGSGGAGQLGLGDTEDYALPQRFSSDHRQLVLSSVTYGGCHSAGMDADGELFVWGDNEKLQLGLDAQKQEHNQQCREATIPESVLLERSGAESFESKGEQTAVVKCTSSPMATSAIASSHGCVACGWKHSLLSTACGKVYAWGTGRSGELGLGDAVLVAPRPTLVTSFEHRDDASLKIQRVLCGWQHSVFHATSGEVFTCGSNRHGQLGTPLALAKVNSVPRAVMIGGSEGADLLASYVAVGWHFALCVAASSTSDLVVWGKGSHGQLGLGHLASVAIATPVPFRPAAGVRAVACGSEHSLVVTNDGELFSCGWGEHGNLGHGDQENRSTFERVTYFSANRLDVRAVAAGGAVSAAIVRPRLT